VDQKDASHLFHFECKEVVGIRHKINYAHLCNVMLSFTTRCCKISQKRNVVPSTQF
jgi:phenylalanyl-tRNA synthetase alpha subunit